MILIGSQPLHSKDCPKQGPFACYSELKQRDGGMETPKPYKLQDKPGNCNADCCPYQCWPRKAFLFFQFRRLQLPRCYVVLNVNAMTEGFKVLIPNTLISCLQPEHKTWRCLVFLSLPIENSLGSYPFVYECAEKHADAG